MTKDILVTVVIPARDEEGAVAQVVRQVRAALGSEQFLGAFEVLVVDDASQDRTAAEATAAGARVLSWSEPRGYGAAVKRGIREAKGQYLCLLDADGSYPATHLLELLCSVLAGADQAIGARQLKDFPWFRRVVKKVIHRLAQLFSGREVADLNSGFRVLRRDRLLTLLRLLPDGFSVTTTLTMGALLEGWEVCWVPIAYQARVGKSKFRPLRDTWRLLLSLLRAVIYFQPLRFFLPVAGIVGLAAVSCGVWDFLVEKNLTDKTVLLSMTALEFVVLGLLADMVVRRYPSELPRTREGAGSCSLPSDHE